MELQLASDLHLEFLENRFPGMRLVEPAPMADILVFGGDIHTFCKALQMFNPSLVIDPDEGQMREWHGHQRALVEEGLASGPATPDTDADWQSSMPLLEGTTRPTVPTGW